MLSIKINFIVILGLVCVDVYAQAKVSTPVDRGIFIGHTLTPNDRLVSMLMTYKMDLDDFYALNPSLQKKAPKVGAEVLVFAPPDTFSVNPYFVIDQRKGITDGIISETIKDTDKGKVTASGALYNPLRYVGSSARVPIGTILYVFNPVTGRSVYVSIIDNVTEVDLALSSAAAKALALDSEQRSIVQMSEE